LIVVVFENKGGNQPVMAKMKTKRNPKHEGVKVVFFKTNAATIKKEKTINLRHQKEVENKKR